MNGVRSNKAIIAYGDLFDVFLFNDKDVIVLVTLVSKANKAIGVERQTDSQDNRSSSFDSQLSGYYFDYDYLIMYYRYKNYIKK